MNESDSNKILTYLGLVDSSPIITDPIQFLSNHLTHLPPHLLTTFFSPHIPPQKRTHIPTIRNRRLRYTLSNPPQLSFSQAKNTWPLLWQGKVEEEDGEDIEDDNEQNWVKTGFLPGNKQHVGHLGQLLSDYEHERQGHRMRDIKRRKREMEAQIPEEDTDSDDAAGEEPPISEAELKTSFERSIKEKFIYGLLDGIDYDPIDWDDKWDDDPSHTDDQERWFDNDDEDE